MGKEGPSEIMSADDPTERGKHTNEPCHENATDTDSDFHSISPEPRPPQAVEGKDEEQFTPSYTSAADRDVAALVPRLKRRGLFGQLTLLAEAEDPKKYSRKKKWFITFIVAWAGATAPMGSAILFRKSAPFASLL
jgi:hypothetical protein